MEQQIDIYGYMLNISVVAFVSLFFIGIGIKISSIFMAILAYPTYIALFTFEHFSNYKKKDLEERKLFRLNIPKENPKRYWMNLIASIVTIFSINIAMQLLIVMQIPKLQINFFSKIFDGTLIPYQISISIIVCIFIIYTISYFVDVDNKTAYDKIESLSIPSLWKKLIK